MGKPSKGFDSMGNPIFNYSPTSPYTTYEAPVETPKVDEIAELKKRIADLEKVQFTPREVAKEKHAKSKPMEKNLRIAFLFMGIMAIACFGIMVDLYIIEPQKLQDSYGRDPTPSPNPCPPGQTWYDSSQVPNGVGGCY